MFRYSWLLAILAACFLGCGTPQSSQATPRGKRNRARQRLAIFESPPDESMAHPAGQPAVNPPLLAAHPASQPAVKRPPLVWPIPQASQLSKVVNMFVPDPRHPKLFIPQDWPVTNEESPVTAEPPKTGTTPIGTASNVHTPNGKKSVPKKKPVRWSTGGKLLLGAGLVAAAAGAAYMGMNAPPVKLVPQPTSDIITLQQHYEGFSPAAMIHDTSMLPNDLANSALPSLPANQQKEQEWVDVSGDGSILRRVTNTAKKPVSTSTGSNPVLHTVTNSIETAKINSVASQQTDTNAASKQVGSQAVPNAASNPGQTASAWFGSDFSPGKNLRDGLNSFVNQFKPSPQPVAVAESNAASSQVGTSDAVVDSTPNAASSQVGTSDAAVDSTPNAASSQVGASDAAVDSTPNAASSQVGTSNAAVQVVPDAGSNVDTPKINSVASSQVSSYGSVLGGYASAAWNLIAPQFKTSAQPAAVVDSSANAANSQKVPVAASNPAASSTASNPAASSTASNQAASNKALPTVDIVPPPPRLAKLLAADGLQLSGTRDGLVITVSKANYGTIESHIFSRLDPIEFPKVFLVRGNGVLSRIGKSQTTFSAEGSSFPFASQLDSAIASAKHKPGTQDLVIRLVDEKNTLIPYVEDIRNIAPQKPSDDPIVTHTVFPSKLVNTVDPATDTTAVVQNLATAEEKVDSVVANPIGEPAVSIATTVDGNEGGMLPTAGNQVALNAASKKVVTDAAGNQVANTVTNPVAETVDEANTARASESTKPTEAGSQPPAMIQDLKPGTDGGAHVLSEYGTSPLWNPFNADFQCLVNQSDLSGGQVVLKSANSSLTSITNLVRSVASSSVANVFMVNGSALASTPGGMTAWKTGDPRRGAIFDGKSLEMNSRGEIAIAPATGITRGSVRVHVISLADKNNPARLARSFGNSVINTVNQLPLSDSAFYDATGLNSFEGLRTFMFNLLGDREEAVYLAGDVLFRVVRGSTDVQVFLRNPSSAPLMQQFQNSPNTQLGLLTQADDQGISHMLQLSDLIPKSRISKKVKIEKSNLSESELSRLLVDLKQEGISAASTMNGIYTLGGPNFDALFGFAPDSILGKIITQQEKGTKIEVVNERELVISDSPTSSGATVAKLRFGETLVSVGSNGMDVAQDMKQFARYNPSILDATGVKTPEDLNVFVRDSRGDNDALIVVTKDFYLLTEKTSNNVQVFERTEANKGWIQQVTDQQAAPLAAGTDLEAKPANIAVIVLTQTLGEDGISHVYAVSGFVPTPVGKIEIDTPLLSEVSIPKLQLQMEKFGASVAQTANGLILFGGPHTYSIDINTPLASYILMQRNSQMRIGSQNQLVISQTPTTSNPAVLKVFHNSQLVRIPESVMGRNVLPIDNAKGIVHHKSFRHSNGSAHSVKANSHEGSVESTGMDVAQDMKQFARYNPTNYDATEAKTAGDLNVLVRDLLGDNNALIVVTKDFYLLAEKTSNNVQVFERTEANNARVQQVMERQAAPVVGTDLAAKPANIAVIVLTQTLGEDGISHVYAVSGFVPTPVGKIEIDTPLLSEVSIPKLQLQMEKFGASVAQTANGLILFGSPNTFYSVNINSPLASYILMQRNSQMRIGPQNQLVISQGPTTSNPAVLQVLHDSQLVRIADSVMGRNILPSTDSGIASATRAIGSEGWTSSKGMPRIKPPHDRVKAAVHSNDSATA